MSLVFCSEIPDALLRYIDVVFEMVNSPLALVVSFIDALEANVATAPAIAAPFSVFNCSAEVDWHREGANYH